MNEIEEQARIIDYILSQLNSLSSRTLDDLYRDHKDAGITYKMLDVLQEPEHNAIEPIAHGRWKIKPSGIKIQKIGWAEYIRQIEEKEELKRKRENEESELSKQVQVLTKKKLEYEETIRIQTAETEKLRAENLRLSNINLINQNELHPVTKTLKYLDLLKWFLAVAGGFIAGVITPYSTLIANTIIALSKK
jgi:hypothetical protein